MEENYKIIVIALLIIIVLFLLRNLHLKNCLLKTIREKEESNKKEKHTAKELEESNKREKSTAKELEKTKIENLRFSLNPHSFKNTLQIIEHLARKTYDSVNSLSGIFDYMLYDAKNKYVPLWQEITFAIDYLKLYRLRLDPTVSVNKIIDEDHLNEWGNNKKIAPLVLAHFIENAFKHGDLNSSKAFIQITIDTLDDNTLIYSVRNRISDKPSSKKGGLGNSTFKERLKLLYKNNFEYDYSITDNVFSANLKLTIYDN